MKKNPTVRDYMTAHPHSVGQEQTLTKAHEILRKHRIRHLPVLHGGHVVGIISERDLHLIETLADVDPDEVTVEDAMTADPYSVGPDMPLGELVRSMAEHKYGAAIVVEEGRAVGLFTTVDALRALGEALNGA